MIKAINMKNFRFGKLGNQQYIGFGMYDTDTEMFLSLDGVQPYVLRTKKIIQSCIDGGWPETMKQVARF